MLISGTVLKTQAITRESDTFADDLPGHVSLLKE
jgi:hypothetical protein